MTVLGQKLQIGFLAVCVMTEFDVSHIYNWNNRSLVHLSSLNDVFHPKTESRLKNETTRLT